jgi:phosphate transport system substrate-binding protein
LRGLARLLALACAASAIAGTALAETIKIGGTGSALGTMQLLAQAFAKQHPGVSIRVVPNLGSSGGIKALRGGALDVAVTARDISDQERAAGLSAFRYGTTAFVFASHATSPALDLTKAKIADLYAGRQASWPNGQAVRLVLRPASDSDSKLLRMIGPEVDAALATAQAKAGMVIAVTDNDTADQIERNPNTFGTATLSLLLAENRNVTVHAVDRVRPSPQTLADGSYPYKKELFIVTTAAAAAPTRQFIEFVRSPQGTDILKKTGHRPG